MSPGVGEPAGGAPPRTDAPPVELLARVRELPGGSELLGLAGAREDVALVGGAVRDLLLERIPRELDVVLDSGAGAFAGELARSLGTPEGATEHERFGTALLTWAGGRIDVAERRAESYPAPGALPQVRPGSPEEDLARRDFTVNAIALALGGSRAGELHYGGHALEDLRAGRLRVLHEGSFRDDPTRLLRLARYRARLGFEVEAATGELAAQALAEGALGTVSRSRIGAELRLALGELDAVGSLAAIEELRALEAIEPRLALDQGLARRALALLPPDGRGDLLLMAVLALGIATDPHEDPEPLLFELLDGLEFTSAERERVMRTALYAPGLFRELSLTARPSELHETLSAHTIEAIALAGAIGEGTGSVSAQAEIWFERLRHIELLIGGQDLLDAGIASGPQLGRRLARTLARKLDGDLGEGRDAELAAALEEQGR